jgi:hypothetical protein
MEGLLSFTKGRTGVRCFLKQEQIPVPRNFLGNLLGLLSKICTYEEEEKKIKPIIIVSKKLSEAIKRIPSCYKLVTFVDSKSGSNIEKALKSLIPFCCNGWCVYINFDENVLEYGVLRAFSGPQGLSLTDLLFGDKDNLDSVDYRLVEIRAINKYELRLSGLSGKQLTIDYRFSSSMTESLNFSELVDDVISGYPENSDKDILKKVFHKLFLLIFDRIHGTIFVVVDSDYESLKKILPDGTWLNEPVDIAQEALNAVQIKDIQSSEKYYGLSGMLLEMMNIDGITIIDKLGRIVAFNVFLNQAKVGKILGGGGARKRAAQSVLALKDSNIIGVFFQSQDGNSFYKRIQAK